MIGLGNSLRATLALALLAGFSAAPATAKKAKVVENLCETASCARDFSNAGLTMSPSGDIYGVNDQDGANNEGSVFRLRQRPGHDTWTYETLYSFCAQTNCTDGSFPRGKPIVDTAGNLYGTTDDGGPTGHGEVFRLSPSGQLDVLYGFCPNDDSCPDGATPDTGLTYPNAAAGAVYDGVSPLIGAAYAGGSSNGGTAYQLTPGSGGWSFVVLTNYAPVCSPEAMVMTTATQVYETQRSGCNGGEGDIALLAQVKSGWKESVVHTFCLQQGCSDGGDPRGPVLIDGSGAIYGGGDVGGTGGGMLYKLTPDGNKWKFSLLHTFCAGDQCRDGEWPLGGLISDASGNLYGTTNARPSDGGTIFEIGADGFKTLYTFCTKNNCEAGSRPIAGVVMDSTGDLLGKTTMDGGEGSGTVFELAP